MTSVTDSLEVSLNGFSTRSRLVGRTEIVTVEVQVYLSVCFRCKISFSRKSTTRAPWNCTI